MEIILPFFSCPDGAGNFPDSGALRDAGPYRFGELGTVFVLAGEAWDLTAFDFEVGAVFAADFGILLGIRLEAAGLADIAGGLDAERTTGIRIHLPAFSDCGEWIPFASWREETEMR